QPGDRIVRLEGQPLRDEYAISDVWARHRPGESIDLIVTRPGAALPLHLRGVFRAQRESSEGTLTHVSRAITDSYPIGVLVVGLAVLFLGLEDPTAWLLALLFGGFISVPGTPLAGIPPAFRGFARAYRGTFENLLPPLFYFFFTIFPSRSLLDRKAPWLKWVGLGFGATLAVIGRSTGTVRTLVLSSLYLLIALGLASLATNWVEASLEERRKIRVIFWGTLVGVVPATLVLAAGDFFAFASPLSLSAVI